MTALEAIRARRTIRAYLPDPVATEDLWIAATSLGLGAAWVGGFRDDEARAAPALDQDLEPLGIVALGHAAEDPPRPYRLPLEDVVREI